MIDNFILLDLGEKSFLDLEPKVIFITHLHSEHAFFIKRKNNFRIDIPIYAPESY